MTCLEKEKEPYGSFLIKVYFKVNLHQTSIDNLPEKG